jgi:hypothetical protein
MDSDPISVIAQNVGDSYNGSAGTIKTIISTLSADIVSVNNPESAIGGTNAADWGALIQNNGHHLFEKSLLRLLKMAFLLCGK